MFYKRQMKKARELYPAGHSTAQPSNFNGLQLLFMYLFTAFFVLTTQIIVTLWTIYNNTNNHAVLYLLGKLQSIVFLIQ